jgi:hypothetical protein
MASFPLLHIYRRLLQVVAVLLIIAGFVLGIDDATYTSEEWNDETRSYEETTDFTFSDFLVTFGPAVVIAIFILVSAELIKLALNVEEHLYHIRFYQEMADKRAGSTTGTIANYVPTSLVMPAADPASTPDLLTPAPETQS